jgi:hypothetical protein
MTRRGKMIWKGMCRYCGDHAIFQNPIEYFAENVVPVGVKTLRRRLNDDNWQHRELVELQQTLKSEELQNDINAEYNEAMA